MNRELHISLLGPLTVTIGNHTVAFRTDAERALLTYLAAQQGIPQRRDTLAALLSPDRGDSDALTYLRNRLTRLRSALNDDKAVPPWLEVDSKQIALRTGDDIVIDVTRFAQLLATVETHPHRQLAGCPTCLASLQTAIDLVHSEVVAGLNFPSETWEAWLVAQRAHTQQRALAAMTLLREARLVRGEWAALRQVAQHQLTLEPWLEAAQRALMTAHYQLGDRNAALAQYDQCVAILWDELGVEPEEATQALRQQIRDSAMAVPHNGARPDNLPLQTGRFFGRTAEKTYLLQRLVNPGVRLITLVGPGGSGKTRLAIEAGQASKTSFPDGVWFVSLDAIKGDPAQITEGIKIAVGEAAGLGHADRQFTGDQVFNILRNKRILLILDNCETVLDELGFIPEWLKRAPQLVILATARVPLHFAAESVVLLDGLPTGDAAIGDGQVGAAEALFAERGQMARADFVISTANLLQVRQICRLVDGLPLGIALAAAWVRRRSLLQIISAIGQSLDFLSTQLRDVDPRHRSMRAVFETSWQLLNAAEGRVLAALAVFPTSFSATAAAAVAGATLEELDLLCEKSLLQQLPEQERYVMHSLLRHFAAEKLATRTPALEQTFVDYFYGFACIQRNDYAPFQPEWRNFSAAITKAHKLTAWQAVLDFVQVLDEPWFRQIRFQEMREGLTLALDAATRVGDQSALARTLLRLGEIEMELNDYGAAETHLTAARQHAMGLDNRLGIAHANYFLARIKLEQTQDDQAFTLSMAAKRIFEEAGDELGIAKNLNQLALWQIKKHRDFQTAQAYLAESIARQRTLPPSSSYVETLRHMARVQSMLEAYGAAEQYLAEAATLSRQAGNVGDYAAVLYERLLLCKRRQQVDEALGVGNECLANFRQLGSLRWEALIKTQLGLLHQAQRDPQQALTLLQEGLQIFGELGDAYEQAYSYYYLSQLYAEIHEVEQSRAAQAQARQLNLTLHDPQLTARLK